MQQSAVFGQAVFSRLQTQEIGKFFESLQEADSTNTIALRRPDAPHGLVISAESQTAGRGRMGRSWTADPGLNLTFSIVLHPKFPPDRFPLITVAGGLAVADAIAPHIAPAIPLIKWPNDIFIDGKKACGMLLESSIPVSDRPSTRTHVVLGIGLNVNQVEFPEEIAGTATSLRLATGREYDRAVLLADILLQVERRYEQIERDLTDELVHEYEQRLTWIGRAVTLRFLGSDRFVEGTILGVDPAGGLRLQTAAGEQVFHSGEVTSNAG